MNDPDELAEVILDVSDAVAIIRFNRPASRNSLSSKTLGSLENTLSQVTTREDLRAIVFTGTGDVFASGADIKELAQLDATSARTFSERGQKLFKAIADARQLTIAAINGFCMGGALDLALACDVRVASAAAVFAHPGATLGIITGWGGTQRLPRLIGPARAFEFFATARRFNAEEALRIGLITGIEDPILSHALHVARTHQQSQIP
jgi:enoyl-CoA hydratase